MSETEKSGGHRSFRLTGSRTATWLAVGLVAVVLLILMDTPWLAFGGRGTRERALKAACQANLRETVRACHLYSCNNNAKLPDHLELLHPQYLEHAKVFSCPSAPSEWQGFEAGKPTPASSSYILVPGLHAAMPGGFIVAYDKSLDNHDGQGRNVAFVDASVEWWPAEREEEFQRRLAEQLAQMKEWKPAGEKYEGRGQKDER